MHQVTDSARQMEENDSKKHEESFKSECTYIIDTVATHIHIKHRTETMILLPKPFITLTATVRNNDATHNVNLKLVTTEDSKINLPALYNLCSRHNLLSVHDIPQRVGPIFITEKKAILLEQNTYLRILGIAPCTHEGHILNMKSTLPTSAVQPFVTNDCGARAIPAQQIPKKNQTTQSSTSYAVKTTTAQYRLSQYRRT